MARAELDVRLKTEASFRESLEQQRKEHSERTQVALQTAAAGQASTDAERKLREQADARASEESAARVAAEAAAQRSADALSSAESQLSAKEKQHEESLSALAAAQEAAKALETSLADVNVRLEAQSAVCAAAEREALSVAAQAEADKDLAAQAESDREQMLAELDDLTGRCNTAEAQQSTADLKLSQLGAALAAKTRQHHEAMAAAEQHKAALDQMSARLQSEVEVRVRTERDHRHATEGLKSASEAREQQGRLEMDAVAAQSLIKTQAKLVVSEEALKKARSEAKTLRGRLMELRRDTPKREGAPTSARKQRIMHTPSSARALSRFGDAGGSDGTQTPSSVVSSGKTADAALSAADTAAALAALPNR